MAVGGIDPLIVIVAFFEDVAAVAFQVADEQVTPHVRQF
jgi:hypothetical protein